MAPRSTPDLTLDGLVHDLRNVLTIISEAAALLGRQGYSAAAAAAIERGVERGRRILESFHENARASLDFEMILENAVGFVADSLDAARGPRIEFRRSVEPGLLLRGNPADWERVLMNLFLNAAQAMPEGGRVEIAARRAGEGIEITVSDTGPGIAPEILPRIFTPRTPGTPGCSTRGEGHGIGLQIVESLVRRHGGSVSARNREGAGAEFFIRLPEA